jgi:hypothetical protein
MSGEASALDGADGAKNCGMAHGQSNGPASVTNIR